MKIKLQDIKKVNALTLLAVGFTVGAIAMSLYYQPKFLSQQQTMMDLASKPTPTPIPPFQYDVSKAVNAGSSYYDVMKHIENDEASHSAIQIINVPDVAPTPIVEYRTQTQYVTDPNMENQITQQQQKINSLKDYQQHPDSTHCIMSGGVPMSDGSCL